MAETLIQDPSTYDIEMKDVIDSMDLTDIPTANGFQLHNTQPIQMERNRAIDEYQRVRAQSLYDMQREIENEHNARIHNRSGDEQFMDPRVRKPDVVSEADAKYRKMIMQHYQDNNEQEGFGYFDHEYDTFNRFKYYHDYLKIHSGHSYTKESVQSILNHREMIDRCFWPNSVEEIINNLNKETHPFAKEILQKMKGNSMLSMKLALQMIRNSENMAYGEILKMEMNVALNKIGDKDFDLGV